HPYPSQEGNCCHCYSCIYSFIVTYHERTGRDLSLRIYNHEKSYETIASPTIDQLLCERYQYLG
ncbi:MAG TPA: hypothetical protein VIG72_11840, partial [Pontibacter sp.]